MSDRIEATERLIATLIAGQARVRHIAHSRLPFASALAIELRASTGLTQRWSASTRAAAPTTWNEDLDQADLVSEPVPRPEEAELAADVGDEQPVGDEETSEAEPGPARRRAVAFSDDDSDDELVQRVEARRYGDRDAPSDEDSDDPDTEEVEEDSAPAAAAAPPVSEEEGQTFVPPTLDSEVPSYWERSSSGDPGEDDNTSLSGPHGAEDDDRGPASRTFSADDLEVEDLRTGPVEDEADEEDEDIEVEDLRTGEVDPDELDDELVLDDDSVEVELDESDHAEEEPPRAAVRSTPPPANEWEEEDRTMLSGSHNEWDGEERTVLHGSDMANVLEEDDAVPGPPAKNRAAAFVEEDEDSDSFGDLSDEDMEDSGTPQGGAAAVRILGVGKAEPVTGLKRRGKGEKTGDPGTEEGVVAASGAEEGDDWGAGRAGASGGLSVVGKRKPAEELPAIPRLTEDESQDVGGAAADGAVVDLDQGSLQAVEEVDPAQLRSFQRAAEEAVSKGDMHQAIVHYRDMLDLAPENLEGYLGRGRCLVHLGDYAAAMSDFQRAEDLDPKSPLPLVEMGNLFFARKEYLRAIQFFDTAIDLDDKNAWAYCYRGICHHYRKKHKDAFQDLQKAYSLDPEIPNIRRYVQMAVKAMEKSPDGA